MRRPARRARVPSHEDRPLPGLRRHLAGQGRDGDARTRRPEQRAQFRPDDVRPQEMSAVPRPGDPVITPVLVAEHGLTKDEYERLVAMLGRTPTFTELGIVGALGSEHWSYKHSRPILKTRPAKSKDDVNGP